MARQPRVWAHRPFPGGDQAFKKNLLLSPGHFEEFDPFLLMAEDWMQTPGGFRDHPHRGFETVTLVLDGGCEHRDSRGNTGVLRSGDVQWMTAGRGVIHSEMPHGHETCHLLQLWVNLPAAHKLCTPRYQDIRAAAMPLARTRPGVEVRVISGTFGGVTAATVNVVPILALVAALEPGTTLPIPVPRTHTVFAYVLAGSTLFSSTAGKPVEVRAGHVVFFPAMQETSADTTAAPGAGAGAKSQETSKSAEGEEIIVSVDASSASTARLVLFAGPPLREPVVAEGPFVMNTHAEIAQAHSDYLAGRFVE
eukprot:m.178841 g.178841  ORF g.178841 m.178841 type:complete len:308 (+) comp15362_c0_seq1:1224-2147(+)